MKVRLLDKQREELIRQAVAALDHAYAPYSEYPVGAALLCGSGRIHDGVNVENASYPAGICAERTAAFKAISVSDREFAAIVVASRNAASPCGICRQVLAEFGPRMVVVLVDPQGTVRRETTLHELLPDVFSQLDLT